MYNVLLRIGVRARRGAARRSTLLQAAGCSRAGSTRLRAGFGRARARRAGTGRAVGIWAAAFSGARALHGCLALRLGGETAVVRARVTALEAECAGLLRDGGGGRGEKHCCNECRRSEKGLHGCYLVAGFCPRIQRSIGKSVPATRNFHSTSERGDFRKNGTIPPLRRAS